MSTMKVTKKHHKHLNNPFPSTPKSLHLILGTLHFNPLKLSSHQTFPIGNDFQLTWRLTNGSSISISHQSEPTRAIWSTVPGQAFVSAAIVETEVEESRGSFVFKDKDVHLVCNHQMIEDIRVINRLEYDLEVKAHDLSSEYTSKNSEMVETEKKFPMLLIEGKLFKVKRKQSQKAATNDIITAKYWMLFDKKNSSQLGFQVKFGKPNFEFQPKPSSRNYGTYSGISKRLRKIKRLRIRWSFHLSKPKPIFNAAPANEENIIMKATECTDFNRICITYSSEKNERFYGFGEQFSHMDFKGKRVPIFVQEQGIGRGDQPITFAANLVSYRAGGDWSTTYAPSPFYITSKMKSLYLEGYNYLVFDLTSHDKVQIQMHGDSIQGRILHGTSPLEFVEHYTESIGRPPELPEWITSGAIVGMQGGTDFVREIWDKLRSYDVPISAFWLQDWVGQRKTVIGSQLWWNWEVDTDRYSGWNQLIKDLRAESIQMMTYCNPCLSPMDDKPNKKRNLFKEAKDLDILVRNDKGKLYMVPNTAFDVGMLDLTHPKTASWFKKILSEMVDDGVRGWMADFGEGLPVDALLYSGEEPITAHNRYPELWAKLNREFVEEWKAARVGKENEEPEEALVFFMRAGFRNSPMWGMLFWEGDQMVSWQSNDGIKSAVVGLLSSGLSGYAFNHSDIGGYCSVNLPFFKYCRSDELLMRWMELNAFTTIFRTHEGNKPSSNSQFYSNHTTLSHFAKFAKVFKAWKFYRIQLIKEASKKGFPVCRHLFLHYPNDEHVLSLTYEQFLVGDEILVVPVLDKGNKTVKVYFPLGDNCVWQHIWTGELHKRQGTEASVEAPMGYPAVFVKKGSVVAETFLQNLRNSNVL